MRVFGRGGEVADGEDDAALDVGDIEAPVLDVPLHARELELAAAAAGRRRRIDGEGPELDALAFRVPGNVVVVDLVRDRVEVGVGDAEQLLA